MSDLLCCGCKHTILASRWRRYSLRCSRSRTRGRCRRREGARSAGSRTAKVGSGRCSPPAAAGSCRVRFGRSWSGGFRGPRASQLGIPSTNRFSHVRGFHSGVRLPRRLTCSLGALGCHPNGTSEAVDEPEKKRTSVGIRNRRIRGRAASRKVVFATAGALAERSLARAPGERESGARRARKIAQPRDPQVRVQE